MAWDTMAEMCLDILPGVRRGHIERYVSARKRGMPFSKKLYRREALDAAARLRAVKMGEKK